MAEPTDDGYRIGGEWLILESNGDIRSSGVTDYRGFTELIDTSVPWLQDPNNIVLIVPSEHVLGVSCEVPWAQCQSDPQSAAVCRRGICRHRHRGHASGPRRYSPR